MDLETYRKVTPYEFALVGSAAYLAVEGPKWRVLIVAPICFLWGVARVKFALWQWETRGSRGWR